MSAGGRKKWESAWRSAMEKYQNQKSPPSASISETPDSSRPGKHVSQIKSMEPVIAISSGTIKLLMGKYPYWTVDIPVSY